jgi:truncated hemoglobin YjbI
MTAELCKLTDEEFASWLNNTHKSLAELYPEKETQLAEFLLEVANLIEDGLYPMTREGFSMFVRDLYASNVLVEEI